ncbi:MAG: flap endonuclease [Actinobacteria bacterium]|nr:MAG: flap endonuclease [Actinomycetota bacterium]
MDLHLIDGTYELFRAHFGAPSRTAPDGREVGATYGIIASILGLLAEPGVTHIAAAFDSVIESFRNEVFPGYKTGAGVPGELLDQFPLAERAMRAIGVTAWSMYEFEADDALASGAVRWAGDVGRVIVMTPDKDLCQLYGDPRIVGYDRRRQHFIDGAAVVDKFGVQPESIPDWLALVGDSADGLPGIPGWGAKSTAAVLSRYRHLEDIPPEAALWEVPVRGAANLAVTLQMRIDEALLYRSLATLRRDVPLAETLDDLRWRGVRREEFTSLCGELGFDGLLRRPLVWDEG